MSLLLIATAAITPTLIVMAIIWATTKPTRTDQHK